MNRALIKPQTLRGFRDYLPNQMIARENLIDAARDVYRSFGFSPIDTPALEYSEILLGKGGDESDKQLFRFVDQGGRDVAMRFDLTVPFARFAAQHLQVIGTPFKRYHIGTVWRAEKPQKGRYREFMQCDFDTIGTDSNASDIETLFVIHDLLVRIGLGGFTIRINNRLVLNGLLEKLDLQDQAGDVLRALDKLPKIGRANVCAEMSEKSGIVREKAEQVLSFVEVTGSPDAILSQLETRLDGSETGLSGVARLRELFGACRSAGLPAERVQLDVSIARGLDYYTGTIYETFLNDLPEIGSVCSGGRYDDLAELFTRQKLPGVGASLGLDRLLAALNELGMIEASHASAPVLVTVFDSDRIAEYLRIGRVLRSAGIGTEVFPEARAIGKQLKYADRRGFRVALIAGSDEFTDRHWQVKDLQTGTQQRVSESELTVQIRSVLSETLTSGSGSL